MNAFMKLGPRRSTSGYTLPETLIAATIGTFVIAGVMVLYVEFMWSFRDTTLLRNTSTRASMALERMVHGISTNAGLLEAQVTGMTWSTNNGWRIAYTNSLSASPNPPFLPVRTGLRAYHQREWEDHLFNGHHVQFGLDAHPPRGCDKRVQNQRDRC